MKSGNYLPRYFPLFVQRIFPEKGQEKSSGDFANKKTDKQVPPAASTDEFSRAGNDFAPAGGEPGSTTGELAQNESSLVKNNRALHFRINHLPV